MKMPACRICHEEGLHTFLSFGSMPLANSFLREEQLSTPEHCFPLNVCFCDTCGLVQLGYVVDPDIMFRDYVYLTSASEPLKAHFAELAEEIIQGFDIPPRSLVVDIGSNDGTLLQSFKKLGMTVLGIEPAVNINKLAIQLGIETINDFFSERVARMIGTDLGQAKVITATNVFSHVNDLDDFLIGVSSLLANDGIFVIEVPYLVDLLDKMEFDTIYHEHLSYFAIRPLVSVLDEFSMNIVKVERINVHGGSLRLYLQKSACSLSPSVLELLKLEEELKLDSLETYQKFTEKAGQIKESLLELLKSLKARGPTIVGYGAPAKGNVLLNYCKIGTDILDYLTDTTPFKQGLYTPGMHIPVFPESRFHSAAVDYALLLSWNYADAILQKEEAYRQAGGKFIVPIPKPRIV